MKLKGTHYVSVLTLQLPVTLLLFQNKNLKNTW